MGIFAACDMPQTENEMQYVSSRCIIFLGKYLDEAIRKTVICAVVAFSY